MPILRASIPLVLILALAACSGPNGAATSTPVPTDTPADPASVALQAASPTATSTPEPAIASPTSTPSPTRTPTSTATATNVPATESAATDTPTVEARTPTPQPTEPEGDASTGSKQGSAGDELAAEIESLLTEREGLYEVVVIEPGGEQVYALNADEQVQAASLYKLLIMVEIYRQVEDGIIALDDPVLMEAGFFTELSYGDPFDLSYIGASVSVENLLRPMVKFSSNVAAYALLDLTGNTNINATVAALGLTASEIRWMPAHRAMSTEEAPTRLASYAAMFWQAPTADEAFNVTSAADMALLFRLLIEGRVVNPEASQAMLDLLAGQVVNNRLPALLPADVVVAHKTGNIDNVIHDAGVIYTPAGPAVVVVLTADALEWEAVEFMRELALLVYEYGSG